MRFTTDKDLNQLIRCLLKEGWKFERKKKHAMLVAPNGLGKVCIALTPSGSRVSNYVRSMTRNIKG